MDKLTPGPISRDGTFLWQEDSPSGAGMNLWSGKLVANNGYPDEHALKAAVLFEAAPALLDALREYDAAFTEFDPDSSKSRTRMRLALIKARAAIVKAGVA